MSDKVRVHQEDKFEFEATNLGGIELELLDSKGEVLSTITTDTDGSFTFNDIMPGTLRI